MKNLILSAVSICAIVACTANKNTNNDGQSIQSIGGKKDKNGCLAAAGQSWIEVRQKCIQIFNEGIRLNPITSDPNKATFSAFVVYPEDRNRAELFVPEQEKSIILTTKDKKIYSNGKYSYNPNTGVLLIDGVKKYQTTR